MLKTNDMFLIEKGRLYYFGGNYVEIWDESFNTVGWVFANNLKEIFYSSNKERGGIIVGGISASDYMSTIGITQTLFNSDENYEYIQLTNDKLSIMQAQYVIPDGLGGAKNIVEEKVLLEIYPPEGVTFVKSEPWLYQMGDNYYMSLRTSDYRYLFYKIEKGGQTAINQGIVLSPQSSESQYYDTSGKRIKNLQKGINIVRLNTGETKKVIVK